MKKQLYIAVFLIISTLFCSCGSDSADIQTRTGLADIVSAENAAFSETVIADIAEQSDFIALLEIDSVSRFRDYDFVLPSDDSGEVWTAHIQLISATVINALSGVDEGQTVELSLVTSYKSSGKELKTGCWESWYLGSQYRVGDRMIVLGRSDAWDMDWDAAPAEGMLYIGTDDGGAFCCTPLMRWLGAELSAASG